MTSTCCTPAELEKRKHKLKRLVQSPNSFFLDVKCPGCFNITTVSSHSQTARALRLRRLRRAAQPTGGHARLTEGCWCPQEGRLKGLANQAWRTPGFVGGGGREEVGWAGRGAPLALTVLLLSQLWVVLFV